ncbi:MAG: hypothetical protein ABRQ25_10145 [Clostridiaceae bacterium]
MMDLRNLCIHATPEIKKALKVIIKRCAEDGRWKTQAHYPGEVHFTMEQAGKISRWNTLRAMRVLNYYEM